MELKDHTVLILGIGQSGLAMTRWALREGARVRVADSRSHPPGLTALEGVLAAAGVTPDLHCGSFELSLLDGVDLVAISPGLALLHEPQRALLDEAARRGLPLWGEIEFFAQKLTALKAETGYRPRVVAITGTNGKTTVTSLTGKLCARGGLTTVVAGNIGPAALDALMVALDATALPQCWVLELSSFQIETTSSLAVDAAAILNISQDHLDWHGSIDAYAGAKERLLGWTRIAILNRDDARVMAMGARWPALEIRTFGLDAPVEDGSFGIVNDAAMKWLALAEAFDAPIEQKRARRAPRPTQANTPELATVKRLMPQDALRIRGDHNAANVLAALALCQAIGLSLATILHGVREYHGEAHRVELVARVHDVDYIDDSKGTNVGATVAALNGLGQRVVLIAGGDGKGQDFSPLAAAVAHTTRALVLIGKDAASIEAAVLLVARQNAIPIVHAASLEEAVRLAVDLARPGDAVLLSPACASLDMFRNYQHRAQVFAAAVAELAMEAGQPC